MQPIETIRLFDAFLSERGLRFDAVVVGGTILNLLGIVSRPTKDCDVVSPTIPPSIADASRVFASETRARGEALADDWLNNGPISIIDVLPAGWKFGSRLRSRARPSRYAAWAEATSS